ncbi:MAG: glutathione S-transferase N-terminal domain-containing protein [Proteobacteria bacterium]|nr:glutathione S-transferase N-terminal domain-containing protein [Pseudomonadota bacterium]
MANEGEAMESLHLIADEGCPYGHRIRALAAHLELGLQVVEGPIGQAHPEALAHSPTGRVPLLVHGSLVLGESVVIGDYLADLGDWRGFPAGPGERARHREAMALFDLYLAGLVFRPRPVSPRAEEVLDRLQELVLAFDVSPCRLAFHVAPFFLRVLHWYPEGPLLQAIAGRPGLRAWLHASCALDPVLATSPSTEESVAHLRAAQPLLNAT